MCLHLKQKVARTFNGRKVDLDVVKKEIKDELTHVLYDQTRRTPIVIPVINEIGGGGKPNNNGGRNGENRSQGEEGQSQGQQGGNGRPNNNNRNTRGPRPQQAQAGSDFVQSNDAPFNPPAPKKFPAPVVPDTEVVEPKAKNAARGY